MVRYVQVCDLLLYFYHSALTVTVILATVSVTVCPAIVTVTVGSEEALGSTGMIVMPPCCCCFDVEYAGGKEAEVMLLLLSLEEDLMELEVVTIVRADSGA